MELEDLRLAVYRSFAATGHAPTTAMLAEQLGTSGAEINSGLEMLAHNRHVVLSSGHEDCDGASVLGSASRIRGNGSSDVVVGRLRMGLLRAASARA